MTHNAGNYRRERYDGNRVLNALDGLSRARRLRPGRGVIVVLLATLLLVFGASGAVAEGWLYSIAADGPRLEIRDADSGSLVRELELPHPEPNALYPTPGGKYVFVTFDGRGEVAVIDAETQSIARRFSFDGFVPGAFNFSPIGHRLYVAHANGNGFTAFDHSQSRLSSGTRPGIDGGGARIGFNRRGSRYYAAVSNGLGYFVEESGEHFRTVRAGDGRTEWSAGPNYRFLWGVTASGSAVVVDERRGRVIAEPGGSFAERPPEYDTQSGSALLLAASRREVRAYDLRRANRKGQVELPARAVDIASNGAGRLWAALENRAELAVVDTRELAVVGTVALAAPSRELAYVTLKKGQGFACF